MHLFHKWIYLYRNVTKEFLGEKYTIIDKAGIRICKICKKTQKEVIKGKSSVWIDLNKQELVILGKKLASKQIFKKDKKNEN
jgi:hypothetical protein